MICYNCINKSICVHYSNIVSDTYVRIGFNFNPRECKQYIARAHNENLNYSRCDEFICSVCGVRLKDWVRFDEEDNTFEFDFNYCPNCGAKIDEKEGI